MYEAYWGLSESPFHNTVDDRWFYESPVHAEALARLCYLIEQQRRCGLLTGPAGTGKSLLLGVLARQIRRTQRQVAVVDLCGLGGHEMLWQLAAALKLGPARSDSLFALWRSLQDHLNGWQLARMQTVLIFDHFDRCEPDCWRIVERLLHLCNGPSCGTTTIVSSRSAELPAFSSVLLQLSDLRIELSAMDWEHTANYVRELLRQTGSARDIFDSAALEHLYCQTGGNPRAINRLCDLSLLAAMSESRNTVDADVVEAAAEETQAVSQQASF